MITNATTGLLKLGLSALNTEDRLNQLKNTWVSAENEEDIFKSAKIDEVSSHLGWLLKQSGLNYSNKWLTEVEMIESRVAILMNTLEEVAQILKVHNISIVALKNAGIAKGIYPILACSPMGDIDLLVSVKDFRKAHQIIINELGFTFKFRSEFEEEDLEEAFKGGGTEYFKEVNGLTVWLELQWRPIAGRWIQPHNEPDGDELMKRSLPIKNSTVRILAPEDNLLQVALHTAKHSYVRAPGFRLHSDVDRIVRYQSINWDDFTRKVKELKLKTAVYFSLFFAKELLETPIPEKVLQSLRPVWIRERIILYYVQKAGFFNQQKKKFSRHGYIIFNLALYDSFAENLKAVFPPLKSMQIKYPVKSKLQLPVYWIIRIKDLLFKRAKL